MLPPTHPKFPSLFCLGLGGGTRLFYPPRPDYGRFKILSFTSPGHTHSPVCAPTATLSFSRVFSFLGHSRPLRGHVPPSPPLCPALIVMWIAVSMVMKTRPRGYDTFFMFNLKWAWYFNCPWIIKLGRTDRSCFQTLRRFINHGCWHFNINEHYKNSFIISGLACNFTGEWSKCTHLLVTVPWRHAFLLSLNFNAADEVMRWVHRNCDAEVFEDENGIERSRWWHGIERSRWWKWHWAQQMMKLALSAADDETGIERSRWWKWHWAQQMMKMALSAADDENGIERSRCSFCKYMYISKNLTQARETRCMYISKKPYSSPGDQIHVYQ